MANIKIMVNWATKKIIHTSSAVGSTEYESLREKGFVKTGVVKTTINTPGFFWENDYFDPQTKYLVN